MTRSWIWIGLLLCVPALGQERKAPVPAQQGPGAKTGCLPLCDMTAKDVYKGEDGGLYGAGQNEPPTAHADAAKAEAEKIQPLDADGKPSKTGKVVLLSIGMSNTTQEFSRFMQLIGATLTGVHWSNTTCPDGTNSDNDGNTCVGHL